MIRHALAVLSKEIGEIMRDRRTWNGIFVMPAMIMVITVTMLGVLEQKLGKEPDLRVIVVGKADTPVVQSFLRETKTAKVTVSRDLAASLAKLKSGDSTLVLEIPEDIEAKVSANQAVIRAHYDKGAALSSIALSTFQKVVTEANQQSLRSTLQANKLPEAAASPITLMRIEASKASGLGASPFASMIPYLVVLFAFTASASSASDLIAGEKERGTMESLLVTPATRRSILLGKWLTLIALGLGGGMSAALTLVVIGALGLNGANLLFPSGVSIPLVSALTIPVMLVALCSFYAGIMALASSFARTMRESQTYLAVVNLLVLAPAVASQVIGFTGMDRGIGVRLIPVLNTSIGLRDALVGKLTFVNFALPVVSCAMLGYLTLRIAFKVAESDQFLRRT